MKKGCSDTKLIHIDVDNAIIDHIDFIFKTKKESSADAISEKSYFSDGSGQVQYDSELGFYSIVFSEEETILFPANGLIYMDTRIVLKDGQIPETEIVSFRVQPTLFDGVDAHGTSSDS